MAEEARQFSRLIELAKEPSSEKRRELLREITDLFLDRPEEFGEAELGHWGEIVGKVAFGLETRVRRELAERLATADQAPHNLIARLANETIEVARPILTRSGILGNADLLAIVMRQSQDHLLAIAERKEVGEEVGDALVARGGDAVLTRLAQNEGAELSRGALETMVGRAEKNEALHAPLVARRDMPPDLLSEMYWWVSSALRQHILSVTADLDPKVLDEALAHAGANVMKKLGGEPPDSGVAEAYIREKERANQLTPNLIAKLLGDGRHREALIGFGKLVGVDLFTAHRILFKADPEALAIACKASGFDKTTFSNLVLATKRGEAGFGEKLQLVALYDRMPTEAAQRTMRFWRARQQVLKPPPEGSSPTPVD